MGYCTENQQASKQKRVIADLRFGPRGVARVIADLRPRGVARVIADLRFGPREVARVIADLRRRRVAGVIAELRFGPRGWQACVRRGCSVQG